jgi:DNA-binding MarR family transcriptional regulator
MSPRDAKVSLARSASDADAATDTERRHMVELLSRVEREANVSQRKLATDLGVALGLVNTYLKRCVRKGLIKVREAPSRRYAYYLTPKGFAEKSRLTGEYLSWSLAFFRRARGECGLAMAEAQRRNWRRVGLAGAGDLAEIAILTASEADIAVAGIVDPAGSGKTLLGVATIAGPAELSPAADGWIVTAINEPQSVYDGIVRVVGAERTIVLPMLSVRELSAER